MPDAVRSRANPWKTAGKCPHCWIYINGVSTRELRSLRATAAFERFAKATKGILRFDSLSKGLPFVASGTEAKNGGQAGIRMQQRFKGEAVGEILAFLDSTTHRMRQSRDPLSPRFLFTDLARRGKTLAEMLTLEAGKELNGMNLEIISPYFDDAEVCSPLNDLIDCFKPKEVRLHLPRDAQGAALVSPRLYSAVRDLDRSSCRVSWGALPEELLRSGPAAQAAARFVHAKVYRFFRANPKREVWIVGSANLTRSAHQAGGNMECVFVAERLLDGLPRPAFLVESDDFEPKQFLTSSDPLEDVEGKITRFALRFDWTTETATAFWEETDPPKLRVSVGGIDLGEIGLSQPNEWQTLSPAMSSSIKGQLAATSLFAVNDGAGHSGHVLIIEEGMTHKPSLRLSMSAADILRYWSMLTPEQRSTFLELRLNSMLLDGSNDGELPTVLPKNEDSLFDRVAGFFHAFHTLENSVRDSIKTGRISYAVTRLFGRKHDSLGPLLDRIENGDELINDIVDRYLIVLCSRQCLQHIRSTQSAFWGQHRKDACAILKRVDLLGKNLRKQLLAADLGGDFLDWFEREFLRRTNKLTDDENN